MASAKNKMASTIRAQLLRLIKDEVIQEFENNKSAAAEAAQTEKGFFNRLCNGKEEATVERLIEIGTNLGWKIELKVDRGKGK